MESTVAYDIYLLGLSDPSSAGRDRFCDAMELLTRQRASFFLNVLKDPREPLLTGRDRQQAENAAESLHAAGALIEIRPVTSMAAGGTPGSSASMASGGFESGPAAPSPGFADEATTPCPACGFQQPAGLEDCQACGVVFAKFEREQVQQSIRDRQLDEAMDKAMGTLQEWEEKARAHLSKYPLPEGAADPFAHLLMPAEIPFLALQSSDGPVLLTSRRILFPSKGGSFASIPYEMIAETDLGGGFTVTGSRIKAQVSFRCELPLPGGKAKSITWSLHKDPTAQHKEVILDWFYSRRFMCGSCGEPDIDFRVEGDQIFARCMRCATDHEIRLDEAMAVPNIVN